MSFIRRAKVIIYQDNSAIYSFDYSYASKINENQIQNKLVLNLILVYCIPDRVPSTPL